MDFEAQAFRQHDILDNVMISSEGKLDAIAKNSRFRSAVCRGRQCAKDEAVVNWIGCIMILQCILVFLLEACKGEQCTKYGVFQTPDHGLIVQLHIIAKGFARACKCDLSQARWRKPPPGRPAPKHVSSFKAAAAAPFYKSESKQSQDPRTHRVTSKL